MSKFVAPRPQTAGLGLRLPKPRNPLVALALMRQAGRHGGGNARQGARREVAEQIKQLGRDSTSSDRSP